jgi:hypothetical protein
MRVVLYLKDDSVLLDLRRTIFERVDDCANKVMPTAATGSRSLVS